MVRIELKKIQHNARMSEETHCYSADLYVDGVLWGQVSNRGTGGCDDFHPAKGRNYGDLMDLDKRIAAEHPPVDISDIGLPGQTMDALADLVNEFLTARIMKRMLAGNLTFFKDGVPVAPAKGSIFTIALKGRSVESLASQLRTRHPSAAILNTMGADDALAAFRRAL